MRDVYTLKDGRKATYISFNDFVRMYSRFYRTNIYDGSNPLATLAFVCHFVTVAFFGIGGPLVVIPLTALVATCVWYWSKNRAVQKVLKSDKPLISANPFMLFQLIALYGVVFVLLASLSTVAISTLSLILGYTFMCAATFLYTESVMRIVRICYRFNPFLYEKYGSYLAEAEGEFLERMEQYGASRTQIEDSEIDLTLREVDAFDSTDLRNDAYAVDIPVNDARASAGEGTIDWSAMMRGSIKPGLNDRGAKPDTGTKRKTDNSFDEDFTGQGDDETLRRLLERKKALDRLQRESDRKYNYYSSTDRWDVVFGDPDEDEDES